MTYGQRRTLRLLPCKEVTSLSAFGKSQGEPLKTRASESLLQGGAVGGGGTGYLGSLLSSSPLSAHSPLSGQSATL